MKEFSSHEELIETLVDYAASGKFVGKISNPTHHCSGTNPFCGDQIEIELQVENGIVKDVSCQRIGCIISRGAAVLLCENVQGVSVAKILNQPFVETAGFSTEGFSTHRQICARLAYDVIMSSFETA